MRSMKLAVLAAIPLFTLGACATGGAQKVASNDEYNKLAADCKARGGFLKSDINRRLGPYEQLNNVCDVTNAPDPYKAIQH